MNKPWICPRCQVVHAPHVDHCNCSSRPSYLPLDTTPSAPSSCRLCGKYHFGPCAHDMINPYLPPVRYRSNTHD